MSEVALKAKEYKSDVKPIWCPGCGDYGELTAFTRALSDNNVDPAQLVVVSGIGCSGRFSHFVKCYSFHTAHGRALPTAVGVKAANPDLTVFCVGGDGDGLGIGGNHIPHASRKNPDITYIIADNGIYGLTKGQTSPTTPLNRITKTAPFGAVEVPVDPVRMFLAYGITFVARAFTSDVKGMTHVFNEAVKHKGFSIVHLLSPCVTYRVFQADALREIVAPIPEDHDTSNINQAFELALHHEKLYTGVFYQEERQSMHEEVKEVSIRARDNKPADVEGIFKLFL